MSFSVPTLIFRIIHVDNLHVYLWRNALHAPNHTPRDGLVYRTIHNDDIQRQRRQTSIPCGPDGSIHDYVSFYFGPRSPMLFQLHTGRVSGYDEGQEPIIYLVSSAQAIQQSGNNFVFSDGHGLASYTSWFSDLGRLDQLDWDTIYAKYWQSTLSDMDRQTRKQAEFLVYHSCPWSLISNIGVINDEMKDRVEAILSEYQQVARPPVTINDEWYY